MGRSAAFFRNLFHRRRVESDLGEEVESYFDLLVEREIARGLSPEEAHRVVHSKMEKSETVKDNVRDARAGVSVETALRDIQYALRVLRKSPAFTVVAVLTLALGIGANTAIFSFINAVMLRLLPVDHPEQLVMLTDPTEVGISVDTTETGLRYRLSYPEFQELRARNTVFSGLFAAENTLDDSEMHREGERAAEHVRTELVSGEFFPLLGVRPVLGRVFTPQEDEIPGANPVAVMSYNFWQRVFGGQASVLDARVRIGQGVFQVIGVAPPGFHGVIVGSEADLWMPLTMQAQALPGRDYLKPRDTLWLQVMGRLNPGVSMKMAESGINVTFQQMLHTWSAAATTDKERRDLLNQKLQLRPGGRGASELRGAFSDPLLLLMAMVAMVLLIACANLANLMLARASRRQREIAIRLALGAARRRIIRQLLTESIVIAAVGGVVGIALALVGTRLLLAAVASGVSNLGLEAPLDLRVLFFTAAISLTTGLLFGLAPAIRSTRPDIGRALAATGRSLMGGRGRGRTARVLVATQVALSLVLVLGAALFARSLHNLISTNLGYSRENLWMARVDPVPAGYKGASATVLYERIRDALRTIPGVHGVTLSNNGLFGGDAGDEVSLEGTTVHDREELSSRWTEIGPDYFATLGVPLLRGRELTEADAASGKPVCVVNEAFARKFYPDSDPIGRHVTDEYPTTRETFEIIGVAANAREHGTTERPRPRFYPNLAHPIGSVEQVTFLVRSSAHATVVASAVRREIAQIDPNVPMLTMRTLTDQIDRHLLTERLLAGLAAFFGAAALLLAAIGVYGVISNSVQQRTAEVGIRIALGASKMAVVGMVLREALVMVVVGVAIGLPAALMSGRLFANRLYGLTAADPPAMVLATMVILVAAVLAAYLPARRAARIDPMIALKYE